MSEEKFFDCIFNKFPNKEVSYRECINIKNQFVPKSFINIQELDMLKNY